MAFFEFIADKIDLSGLNVPKNLSFDDIEVDKNLLTSSIASVLKFNLLLSEAIEAFDDVSGVYCTNHISFCSKFLHFYNPCSVFIIDSYAYEGAKALFNGKADESRWRYICNPNDEKTYSPQLVQNNWKDYAFDKSVYEKFNAKNVNKMAEGIKKDIEALLAEYKIRKSSDAANAYIEHCVRSYFLACLLEKEKIEPNYQDKHRKISSMPRLVDTVFLNIKKKP